MDNPQERSFEYGVKMGWLSCAIESEGSIALAWGRQQGSRFQIIPRIMVSNIKLAYVENAQKISYELGVGCHILNQKGNLEKKRTSMYRIDWYGFKRVKSLLNIIKPFLVIKKDRADLVLEFINYRKSLPGNTPYGEKELSLFHAIRDLNGKGILPKSRFLLQKKSSETNTSNILTSEDRVHSLVER